MYTLFIDKQETKSWPDDVVDGPPPQESQCKEKMDETTYFYNIISLKKDGNEVQKLEEPTCEITYGKDNYCPKTNSQEFPTTKKSGLVQRSIEILRL